jgi:hypothetical protein
MVPTCWARHPGMTFSGNSLPLTRIDDMVSPTWQLTNQIAGPFAVNARAA